MKNRFSRTAISGWQKIALVLFGLALSLVLLEAGLRLGGFVLQSIQEYGNSRSIKQKGAYRILCLGESTTAGQYPHLLEQVLNQRNIGVRFSVIDKGVVGTKTTAILKRVESYLTEYRPDMVVAMMGTNDGGRHMPLGMRATSERTSFIRSLRIYYLARLLGSRILTKAKETGFYKPDEDKRGPGTVQTPVPETGSKETSDGSVPTEGSFGKSIEPDPENDKDYIALGQLFQKRGQFLQAEDSFKKAIEINPANDKACDGLGWLYLYGKKAVESKNLFGDPDLKNNQTESLFKKAIELNPGNVSALFGLGWLYWNRGKLSQAEAFFKKAIELNPGDASALFELGEIFRRQAKFSQAMDFYMQAIELNPENYFAFLQLGWLYRCQGKLSRAEDILREAIERHPKNDLVLAAMASLYEEMGKPELAQEYAEKAARFGLGDTAAVTVSGYRELKEILDKRGIKLVCVQYPARNVEPLKKIFGRDESVIFVDNESIFKEAVKKDGYKEYFTDMFAADFGHCTPKGNMLLAQNIAEVILREVFNK